MSHVIVFPRLEAGQAKTVYSQILKLRSIRLDRAGGNIRGFVNDENSVRIALVLISDDPTQMRLVSHVPTIVLEDLRCAKLVSSRMADQVREVSRAATTSGVGKEEFEKLVSIVSDFQVLLVQNKQATIEEVGVMLGEQSRAGSEVKAMIQQTNEGMKAVQYGHSSITDLLAKVLESIGRVQLMVNRFYSYMKGFTEQCGYSDPVEALEQGIARSITGRR